MALVIFCVALVAAMRTRMSLRLGMCEMADSEADDRRRKGTGSSDVSIVSYRLSGVCPPSSGSPLTTRTSCYAKVLLRESLGVFIDRGFELRRGGVVEIPAIADGLEDAWMLRAYQPQQAVFEGAHPVDRDRVEIGVDAGKDDDDLLLHLERGKLRMLENIVQPRAAF